jgi:hypothetical protein
MDAKQFDAEASAVFDQKVAAMPLGYRLPCRGCVHRVERKVGEWTNHFCAYFERVKPPVPMFMFGRYPEHKIGWTDKEIDGTSEPDARVYDCAVREGAP